VKHKNNVLNEIAKGQKLAFCFEQPQELSWLRQVITLLWLLQLFGCNILVQAIFF